jgi:hypothetical protein
MDFYYNAPVWNDEHCPHTFKTAEPRQAIDVTDVTVIEVDDGGAYYRGSTFSGRFVVADARRVPAVQQGSHRIPVFCLWFGHRLVEQAPKVLFDMTRCRVIHNFTGRVDINLQH